jgi:hypothetical protein
LAGPFLSLVDLWHHFASAAWIPAVFLAVERSIETRRPRDAVLLGLAIGLQVLAGSADVCAMTLLALAGWVVSSTSSRAVALVLPLAAAPWLAVAALSSGLCLTALDAASAVPPDLARP